MKQRTITREVSIEGKSLHTGEKVCLTLKPAPVDNGVIFRCVNLYGKPEIKPSVDQITDLVRSTTVSVGNAKINTVEHILSALHGSGVDNVFC
jgi:UDP-3-O-[3-hydroxymyristoyl] N-acetylglucosamine deacetylase/3-hydroxyacyl-[acyl-carrier-protein] dehydratase